MRKRQVVPSDWLGPDDEEAFYEWEKAEKVMLRVFHDLSREDLICFAKVFFWLHDKVAMELAEVRNEIDDYERQKQQQYHAGRTLERTRLRKDIQHSRLGQITRKNLASGRSAASKQRTAQAREIETKLDKAVHDLFRHGEGWKMSNKQVAAFLSANGFGQHYTHNTLLRKLAPLIAQIRKSESTGQ